MIDVTTIPSQITLSAADAAERAIEFDAAFATVVLIALGFVVLFAIWALVRNSASPRDVAELNARLVTVENSTSNVSARLREVEDKISHLPTIDHVHALDVRVERMATVVESSAKQLDRIYDHMMHTSSEAAG